MQAPADGEVTLCPTKHAVGFRADAGHEMLIHVGIDTVSLSGDGFEAFVSDGDHVRAGEPLLKVDIRKIGDRVPSMASPVLFTDLAENMEVRVLKKGRSMQVSLSWKCTGKLTLDFADPECENKRKWVDYGEVSVYNYRRDRNSRKTGGELAKLSKEFRSKITLKTDTKQADAEKLMAVMALGSVMVRRSTLRSTGRMKRRRQKRYGSF